MYYDIVIEMLIKRELRLEIRETSIVCSAIPFGVKFNILLALLNRDPANEPGISLIRIVQKVSERNSLVHGFISDSKNSGDLRIVNRDVRNGKYTVKSKSHNPVAHLKQFADAFERFRNWANFTNDDIERYCTALEADAKAHQDQDSDHPESPTNSQLTTEELSPTSLGSIET